MPMYVQWSTRTPLSDMSLGAHAASVAQQHNALKDDLRKRDIRNSRMTGLTPDGRRPSQEQTPSKDEEAAINRAASGKDSGGGAIVGAWRKAATVAPAATPQPPPAESSPVVPVADEGEG